MRWAQEAELVGRLLGLGEGRVVLRKVSSFRSGEEGIILRSRWKSRQCYCNLLDTLIVITYSNPLSNATYVFDTDSELDNCKQARFLRTKLSTGIRGINLLSDGIGGGRSAVGVR